ncbi:MAG: CoA-binding protein, partial [Pseudomonadota bacterium]
MKRLLAPKDIAVIGGGAWCESIVEAARKLGFKGTIMPVHPSGREIAGLRSFRAPGDLPKVPDAAFVGVNRDATLEIVGALSAMGAGGAVCFASGFREAAQEDESAPDREAALIAAAGAMPILGPNCYGFLNALDGAGLWPDQHGLHRVTSGVAIITQSSNIAINLTMQSRGLPIGQVITCGNQAQTRQAELASAALDDPRITAIGLHIEGFGDLRVWEALARKAHGKGIPLIALKAGRSDQARAAALSHTASMTGADAGAEAFLRRLGITRAHELPVFLEALKIAHLFGPLPGARLGSISCSGGEAALVSDTGFGEKLSFPPLSERQRVELRAALGPRVALANPLDYHTYIWRDEAAMSRAWAAMAGDNLDLVLVILDYPRADICDPADWAIATRAAIAASRETGARYAVCATLPELMPERTAKALFAEGVLPISGLDHGLKAIAALADVSAPEEGPVLLPGQPRQATLLDEAAAKEALGSFGLAVPKGYRATRESAPESAATLEG